MLYFTDRVYREQHLGKFPELERLLHATAGFARESFWAMAPEFECFFRSDFAKRFLEFEATRVGNESEYDSLVQDTSIEVMHTSRFKISIGKVVQASSWEPNLSRLACYANDF